MCANAGVLSSTSHRRAGALLKNSTNYERIAEMEESRVSQVGWVKRSILIAATLVMGGCATIPDVTVAYRPVKWAVLATVVHTVTCNRQSDKELLQRAVSFTPLYSADAPDDKYQIRMKGVDRYFADAEMAVALTDDGRLKSINSTSTGQGDAVVKGLISLGAATHAAMVMKDYVNFFSKIAPMQQDKPKKSVCDVVKDFSTAAPDQVFQVAVVQSALVLPDAEGKVPESTIAQGVVEQAALREQLTAAGMTLQTTIKASIRAISDKKDAPLMELQPFATFPNSVADDEVPVRLQRVRALKLSAAQASDREPIQTANVQIPTKETFVVPIPKAALFGKQTFSMTLAETGKVTSIGYGRLSGAPAALGAATSIAGISVTEDGVDAAALKAAADILAQQNRIRICNEKPADCK